MVALTRSKSYLKKKCKESYQLYQNKTSCYFTTILFSDPDSAKKTQIQIWEFFL